MHLSRTFLRTPASLVPVAAVAAMLITTPAASASPPPASSIPPPLASAAAPPPGITAGPSRAAAQPGAGRSSGRWVRAALEAVPSRGKGQYARIRAVWSCHAPGSATLFLRDHGRWVRRASHHYGTCDPKSHTATMHSGAVARPVGGVTNPVKLLVRFDEAGHTSKRVVTLRHRALAGAAADRWWTDGDARCSRTYTSGDFGQVVIDVDPSATFGGARTGDTVEWQSWLYVYDESLPLAQRGRWVAHPAGTFWYTVNLGYATSGYLYNPWGDQVLSLGGTAPGGNSGVQTWNVQNGLWVRPAIAVKYPGRADWNYVQIRDGGVSGGWCRFS